MGNFFKNAHTSGGYKKWSLKVIWIRFSLTNTQMYFFGFYSVANPLEYTPYKNSPKILVIYFVIMSVQGWKIGCKFLNQIWTGSPKPPRFVCWKNTLHLRAFVTVQTESQPHYFLECFMLIEERRIFFVLVKKYIFKN